MCESLLLIRLLKVSHGKAAARVLCREADLVPGLDLIEHGGFFHLEHHGHGGHAEVLERAMTDDDLLCLFVDFAYFAFGECGAFVRITGCSRMDAMILGLLRKRRHREQSCR